MTGWTTATPVRRRDRMAPTVDSRATHRPSETPLSVEPIPVPRPDDGDPADALPPEPGAVDRPWLVSWPPGVPDTWSYPVVGVDRLVADAARDVPDTVAARDSRHEVTWARLAAVVDDVARAMASPRPDRVVVSCSGGLDALVVALATWRLGAVLEVVDPTAGRGGRTRHDAADRHVAGDVAGGPIGPAGTVEADVVVAEPRSPSASPDAAHRGAGGHPPGNPPSESSDAPEPRLPASSGPPDTLPDRPAPSDRSRPPPIPGRTDEVVIQVVDPREGIVRSRGATVLVADVGRILDRGSGRGRLRTLVQGRGPRIPGRSRLSTLVARSGQASLRPVDADADALVLHTAHGPVRATQRHLVAAAFQVRLWIPDMATGTEVVAAARGWWQPGGWVLGPLLAALTGGTCQLADADLPATTIPGATIAFGSPAVWTDLVSTSRWRPRRRRAGRERRPLASLRVAGVVVDRAGRLLGDDELDRVRQASEGARVRHVWQLDQAVGPVLAQPVYGRFHGDPGALPLPDTVLARHRDRVWVHGPQVTESADHPGGWRPVTDPTLPLADLLGAGTDRDRPDPVDASTTTSRLPDPPGATADDPHDADDPGSPVP